MADTRSPGEAGEAPRRSVHAAPTSAPDFSALALEHLAQRCDAFRQHVREHLERPAAEGPLAELVADLQRFRNTLVLLERTGAVFVAEELLALLEARARGTIGDEDELARVLVAAGERLGDHVVRLGRGGGGEGALSLLPLVNDSRACRGAPLLSEALLLAAGIALPSPRGADGSDADAGARRDAVAERVRALHAMLETGLGEGLGAGAGRPETSLPPEPFAALEELQSLCETPSLAHLQPLFLAAGVLLEAIGDGVVATGAAPRRLFERFGHWLADAADGTPEVPPELYRDLLYYVALIDPAGRPAVAALHERFDLGRIRPALRTAIRDGAGTALGPRLSGAIRDSIDAETSALRQWLDQAPTAADHPKVLRLRERLAHIEPVLTLLGARDARFWLRRINETLDTLSGDAPVGATERLMLAESLIRLDRALDESADPAAAEGRGGVRRGGTEGDDAAARRVVDEAATRCLEEARRRLIAVGESLDAPRLVGGPPGDAELVLVERALSVLALVEIGPLLRGLRAANARVDAGSPPAVRDALAGLIASLEFYLGCVMQSDGDASARLLGEAAESLERLEARLPPLERPDDGQVPSAAPRGTAKPLASVGGNGARPSGSTARAAAVAREVGLEGPGGTGAGGGVSARGGPPGDDGDGTAAFESGEGGRRTREALACMDAIGEVLIDGADAVTVDVLRAPFEALAGVDAAGTAEGLGDLAVAVAALLERVAERRGGATARLRPEELVLIEEAHAALPQLIERMHGASERVRGLDGLLAALREARVAVPDAAGGGSDEAPDTSAFDDTLQEVFRRECATHIDALERAVTAALGAFERRAVGGEAVEAETSLPSDTMLRALHTLSGSAQTADARHIVAVVQPLQRVALARQRADLPLDEGETRYAGELVGVLRARLDALENGVEVDEAVREIESRLPGFVARALAATRDETSARTTTGTPAAASAEASAEVPAAPPPAATTDAGTSAAAIALDDVFDEEAHELLERVRRAIEAGDDIDGALGHLHTLKGGARMAGRDAVAERAHALEGRVQGLADREARRRALADGRRELQRLLLDTRPLPGAGRTGRADEGAAVGGSTEPANAHDTAAVAAATFETLLTLATDVTVSQARLSDDIARLREACRDLESAAGRWRSLPRESGSREAPLLETPAAREMLADLDTARRGLSDALRLADAEQQHASRAASSLQQMLIRTRLVRVEELRERLAATVRDAAEATGREVRLVLEGGDLTLDGSLCRQLRAPLEHLARNAVVHGIEPPETRRRVGKDPCGTVRLSAVADGTDIVLVVEDDGVGIDRDAISRRREAAGLAAVDTVDALQDVLCEAGFTTLDAASEVGGRGLGLSAVSATLARLDGRMQIGTRPGAGTAVSCRLRQRIVVGQVVLVRCAKRLYALPVNVVRRVGSDDDAAGTTALPALHGGSSGSAPDHAAGGAARPPRLSLLSLLGGVVAPAGREDGETDDTGAHEDGSAELVVEIGGQELVLEVDRVLGYRELLTQPLGPQLAALQRYAGGSVLPDGRQVLVVEIDRLVGQWRAASGSAAPRSRPDPETMRPVALVVDDSITLRVAAAAMLERNGVESREARDGIEALDSLSRALPELMIVDLDMPRLGGFDLIRRTRERHGERAPPVIVISSRDGEADRARAAALGVVRYLTKPYTEPQLREALLASGLRLPDLTIA